VARLENSEIAAIFAEMADLLQITGGDRHRISSFRRSARVIERLAEPAETMLRFGTLEKAYGIGPGTVHRVKQILRSGSTEDLRALKAQLPPGLREMLKIKGVGPTTVRRLYNTLGLTSVDALEQAALSGRLAEVPRMGVGTVSKILSGIQSYRRRIGRFAYADAKRAGDALVAGMRECPEALRVALAGSVRRGKATIGDLDILVAADDPGPVTARFITLPRVDEVLLHGTGRASVRVHTGQQVDLRVLPPPNFGAGLHYFTGSKLHNIAIRRRGNQLGIKISDKGVFTRGDERLIIPGEREEEIFEAVGLPFIAPELREDSGEVDVAAKGRLPKIVGADDLRGDLHMHTLDSDGKGTALEMAERAKELGLDYIAITDHSQSLTIANGLDEARLAAQLRHVRELDRRFDGVRILAGIEVDILPDGSLDIDEALLAQLDWVVASIHLYTELPGPEMTARVIRAMETGVVDVIGHPTGRRPGRREAYAMDMEAIVAAARRLDVALEVNGGPNRMDLDELHCRRAREAGVPLVISTDAHSPRHVGRAEYGLAMARRGWAEPRHVLNTRPWEYLSQRRRDRLRARDVSVSLGRGSDSASTATEDRVSDDRPRHEAHGTHGEDHRAIGPGDIDTPDEHAWGEVDPDDGSTAPLGSAVDGPAANEDAVADLLAQLRNEPRPPDLAERIQRFLHESEADPVMGEALRSLDPNPLQLAFNLLMGASLGGARPSGPGLGEEE
jgi:DNA polymerase (family 10)